MKMDVDEFGARVREIAGARNPIAIVEDGRVVGHYVPVSERWLGEIDLDGWIAARARFRERWKARTPNWRERLESYGLDEDGEPFDLERPRFPE